jgi:hypothetical protein
MSIELLGSLVVLKFLAFILPMRCQGAIARPPFRGCRIRVYGFLGHCRNHGFQPQRRMMSALGGQRLAARRTCSSCGRPAVFCRRRDTGRPFLGCTGFPECKNPRWLGNWTLRRCGDLPAITMDAARRSCRHCRAGSQRTHAMLLIMIVGSRSCRSANTAGSMTGSSSNT